MNVLYSRTFERQFKRCNRDIRAAIIQRQELFVHNRRNDLLRDHALSGELKGSRSFSVTGDIRVIYRFVEDSTALFLEVGTHHELYGS